MLLSSPANDWLHANSIQYLASDGDFLMSLRDQDWVVKIDYSDGSGTGNILWRLGNQGDFSIPNCPPPYSAPACPSNYPWFSAQHALLALDDHRDSSLPKRLKESGGTTGPARWRRSGAFWPYSSPAPRKRPRCLALRPIHRPAIPPQPGRVGAAMTPRTGVIF